MENVIEKFGRFRILVIGRANAGKTTLLQRVCNTTEKPKIFDREGKEIDVNEVKPSVNRGHHDIRNELVFGSNPDFVFHDSCGFEAGGEEEFEKMKEFVSERASTTKLNERIHAIWYCVPMDEHHRAITMAEEKFFSECDTNNVPVVVVFTKFDALSAVALGELRKKSGLPRSKIFDMIPEHAKKIFTDANIWDRLCGQRYPPKDYVTLAEMNKDHADCAPLLVSTTSALGEETLQMLLISTQRTNIKLCIKYAVERVLMRRIKQAREGSWQFLEETCSKMQIDIALWFPHTKAPRQFGGQRRGGGFFEFDYSILAMNKKIYVDKTTHGDVFGSAMQSSLESSALIPIMQAGISMIIIFEHSFFLLQQRKDDTGQILKLATNKYMTSHIPAAVEEAVEEVLHQHYDDSDQAMLCKMVMDIILQNCMPLLEV